MQFEFTGPQTIFEEMIGGQSTINAFGKIGVGDCDKFLDFLTKSEPPPRSDVHISSEGGSVDDAMKIGLLIRGGWFSTHVGMRLLDSNSPDTFIKSRLRTSAYCMSAATLMYLGGRLRFMSDDAKFGVHQFSFQKPDAMTLEKSQKLSADMAFYVSKMGINPEFLQLSASVPSSKIDLVGKNKLQELGVVTGGITPVEWTLQARNNVIYLRGERDSIFGHHKIMITYNREIGFHYWGVIEAQGREAELLGHGLVEITLNNEGTRINISDRCQRELVGNYINVIAPIDKSEVSAIADATDMGLQLRFSSDAEIFLGISGMDTEGAEELLKTITSNLL